MSSAALIVNSLNQAVLKSQAFLPLAVRYYSLESNFHVRFFSGRVLYAAMILDCELLRRYAETKSEDAFAELVRRHINLVYSAAMRQVHNFVASLPPRSPRLRTDWTLCFRDFA